MGAKGSMPIENLQFQECIFFGLFGKDCSSRSRRRRSAAKLQHREQLGKSLLLLHNKSFKSLVCYIYIYAFMHLADAFIQSDLQYIQVIHILSVCVFSGN